MISIYFSEDVMSFDNYREFLLYVYNTLVSEGKIDEMIEWVKNQPKGPAFDFDRNTEEGMYFYDTINNYE